VGRRALEMFGLALDRAEWLVGVMLVVAILAALFS
jgi:hypothetical protein